MTKKQRRKQKILVTQKKPTKQQLQWLKQDRAYRYCSYSTTITPSSMQGGYSNYTDNIFPNDPRWKEEDWKKRYDNSASISFASHINKVTIGTITTLTIGNETIEIGRRERVLFEGEAQGEFCLAR